MSTIEDKLDAEFAAAWRPDPGDKIAGEVVAIGERQGQYDPYVVVTLRRDDGEEFAIHAFHQVLGAQLAALRPQLGDKLALKYQGKKQNQAGTGSYHAYRAVKDGDEAGIDWSKYDAGEPEPDGGSDLPSTDAQPDDFAATADQDEPLPF